MDPIPQAINPDLLEITWQAISGFFKSLDWWYVLGTLFAGKFLTDDKLVRAFPVRATLQRIDKAVRVAIVSLILGVVIFYLREYDLLTKTKKLAIIETMMHSFFFANGMYALLLKRVFNLVKINKQ